MKLKISSIDCCVKSVQIRSFFFVPNTGKDGPEKTDLNTSHAVDVSPKK